MVAYLADGWFSASGPRRLRAEVVDGALDSAGFLVRAGLQPHEVLRLALRVRALTGLLDPLHRHVHAGAARPAAHPDRTLPEPALRMLRQQLVEATDACVELQSFVCDCLDHVADLDALRGLFLHLAHVAHVMRLLASAQKSDAVQALLASVTPRAPASGRVVRPRE